MLRTTAMATLLLASVVALTGCLGSAPDPTPTPTGVFASEEEAFEAAEETYRAYIDAVNARYADPRSVPDPQSFLVGSALDADISSEQEMDQLGIHIVGTSAVSSVGTVSADPTVGDVVIRACLDSTEARVTNDKGEDVTLPDRDPTVLAEVHMTAVGGELRIHELLGVVSDEC